MTVTAAFLGVITTFSIFLVHVIYQTGRLAARVDELEKWRISMRVDMHEISDKLGGISEELRHLSVLIDERTERRQQPRENERFSKP